MSADTHKAKLAIEALRKYLAEDHVFASEVNCVPSEAVIDLIDTYEWLLDQRAHLKAEHDALKQEHETMIRTTNPAPTSALGNGTP